MLTSANSRGRLDNVTNDMLLHIHIPKTAGTSVRRALVDTYGPEAVYYYNCGNNGVIRSSDRGLLGSEKTAADKTKYLAYRSGLFPLFRQIFARAAEHEAPHYTTATDFFASSDVSECQAVSGHFDASLVEAWGLQNNLGFSLVREPLARALSHYHHYVRAQGKLGTLASSAVANLSGLLSLDEFLELPEFTNMQTRYVGQLANIRVATIDNYMNVFEELGLTTPTLLHLNKTPNIEHLEVSRTAAMRFAQANAADYELFGVAQSDN